MSKCGKAPFWKGIPPLEEMSRSDKGGAASARGWHFALRNDGGFLWQVLFDKVKHYPINNTFDISNYSGRIKKSGAWESSVTPHSGASRQLLLKRSLADVCLKSKRHQIRKHSFSTNRGEAAPVSSFSSPKGMKAIWTQWKNMSLTTLPQDI